MVAEATIAAKRTMWLIPVAMVETSEVAMAISMVAG